MFAHRPVRGPCNLPQMRLPPGGLPTGTNQTAGSQPLLLRLRCHGTCREGTFREEPDSGKHKNFIGRQERPYFQLRDITSFGQIYCIPINCPPKSYREDQGEHAGQRGLHTSCRWHL